MNRIDKINKDEIKSISLNIIDKINKINQIHRTDKINKIDRINNFLRHYFYFSSTYNEETRTELYFLFFSCALKTNRSKENKKKCIKSMF